MFSPLPPTPNGIADYTFEILQSLGRVLRCFVVTDDTVSPSPAPDGVTVMTLVEYELKESHFAEMLHVYQVGNNPDHVYMLSVMARHPGLVVLHDPNLHHLLDCATLAHGDVNGYCDALQAEYGTAGQVLGEQFRSHRLREQRMFFDLPMVGALLGPARGVIVHSRYAAIKVIAQLPDARVTVVPHQYSPPQQSGLASRAEMRGLLGASDDDVIFMSLGFVTKPKKIENTLRALSAIRKDLPPFRYVIAGELRPKEVDVSSLVNELELDRHVSTLGYVPDADFFSLIEASDVVVNLRHPTGGETSGSMIRALGGGACTVVVDQGPFAEIPNDAACKVQWGAGFEARLGENFLMLARDSATRTRIGAAARRFIKKCNSLEATVAGYLEAIGNATSRPAPPWLSSAVWEAFPPHEFERVTQDASGQAASLPLPLWFTAFILPTCERPVRAACWGGTTRDKELFIELGHNIDMIPLVGLTNAVSDIAAVPKRALDLAMIFAMAKALPDGFAYLMRLNRTLTFGGLAIISLGSDGTSPPNPLQFHDEGTRLLEAFGFRVDHVAVVAPASLSGAKTAGSTGLNTRCWRAVKISEFITRRPDFAVPAIKVVLPI